MLVARLHHESIYLEIYLRNKFLYHYKVHILTN